jgi:hypothetical protein
VGIGWCLLVGGWEGCLVFLVGLLLLGSWLDVVGFLGLVSVLVVWSGC